MQHASHSFSLTPSQQLQHLLTHMGSYIHLHLHTSEVPRCAVSAHVCCTEEQVLAEPSQLLGTPK